MLYSHDKIVANAIHRTCMVQSNVLSVLITGDPVKGGVERTKQIFINIDMRAVLIGTDALATGIDGIDVECDHLLIFDDTEDPSMRRQLIGRVLPRGTRERDTIVTTVVAI
jgi:hypothetical protein